MRSNKKGQVFANLSGILVGLATMMIVAVVTFLIVAQAQDEASSIEGIDFSEDNSTSRASITYNATQTAKESMDTAVNFFPLIAIGAVGAVLIGLVMLFRNR